MLPSGSFDALPSSVVLLFGRVRLVPVPAFATGGWLTGGGGAAAAFTVTVTVEEAVAPALSVIVKVNTYTPCDRLLTAVVAAAASVIL